ncbi:MAG: hypothetical protein A2843_00040 [Candidatus Wildermuthbacteria bacterium RIFCSPHIGHO2_01_FULL_48_27b]|uniref:Uncharacterized protein n=1 Tax=Candidatus Wildermuthbacteria bacterium RIFCSPHIGHO2_01_FULL_48_27b TaxID=1802447 RepID=A0A1G2QYI5_9BACT|nr:MAG: hypothetical protein A2843_00040 [Candidatus Wildermuthbacteria bacterium RIFCSPHIGHO2_01_FULL_48_27b]
MAILAGIFAVVVNRVFCLLLLRTEKRLAEKGVISQRGEILYLEDYNFFKWGDNWFLSLMDFAIAFVLVERWPLPALWTLLLCLLVGLVWTAIWHRIWLSWGYTPASFYPHSGVTSPAGRIHLVYYGAQWIFGFVGLAMIVLMAMGQRAWSPDAFLGLGAAACYFVTFFSDLAVGRLKRRR